MPHSPSMPNVVVLFFFTLFFVNVWFGWNWAPGLGNVYERPDFSMLGISMLTQRYNHCTPTETITTFFLSFFFAWVEVTYEGYILEIIMGIWSVNIISVSWMIYMTFTKCWQKTIRGFTRDQATIITVNDLRCLSHMGPLGFYYLPRVYSYQTYKDSDIDL